MFYTVYKITNKINGKTYIGAHQTSNLDDGYMGSGKLIKAAITKYGLDAFEKKILFCANGAEEMFRKEQELVVIGEDSYNLQPGGKGGWQVANQNNPSHTPEHRQMMLERKKHKLEADPVFASTYSEMMRKKGEATSFANRTDHLGGFTGKQHSEYSKRAISTKLKGTRTGNANPMAGRAWVSNPVTKETKLIRASELPGFLEKGWLRGKKC